MAYGLLARLYINWPVYTAPSVDQYEASAYSNEKLNDCVAACDKIISSGKFALGPVAYRFKFGPNNTELVEKVRSKTLSMPCLIIPLMHKECSMDVRIPIRISSL